jgi:predicted rRNA methylase YqxC with S4 and FtsJ domains
MATTMAAPTGTGTRGRDGVRLIDLLVQHGQARNAYRARGLILDRRVCVGPEVVTRMGLVLPPGSYRIEVRGRASLRVNVPAPPAGEGR